MKNLPRLLAILSLALASMATVHAQLFLTNGLVAYYPFNGNANDAVGTNNGTIFAATLTNDRYGNPNSAYSFNGTNAYIRCPDTGFPAGNAARTVSLWMNVATFLDPTGTITYPFSYGVNGTSDAFYEIVTSIQAGGPYIAVGKAGGGDTPRVKWSQTNLWCHVAITYTNSTANIYLNGAIPVQASRSYATTLTGNFYIGRYIAGFPPTFYGAIDDLRVYSRALSTNEVVQLYQYESSPKLSLVKAVKPSFSFLSLGTNYQLQVSGNLLSWTNQGSPFTATNTSMVYPQYWDVDNWGQLYFRLQLLP